VVFADNKISFFKNIDPLTALKTKLVLAILISSFLIAMLTFSLGHRHYYDRNGERIDYHVYEYKGGDIAYSSDTNDFCLGFFGGLFISVYSFLPVYFKVRREFLNKKKLSNTHPLPLLMYGNLMMGIFLLIIPIILYRTDDSLVVFGEILIACELFYCLSLGSGGLAAVFVIPMGGVRFVYGVTLLVAPYYFYEVMFRYYSSTQHERAARHTASLPEPKRRRIVSLQEFDTDAPLEFSMMRSTLDSLLHQNETKVERWDIGILLGITFLILGMLLLAAFSPVLSGHEYTTNEDVETGSEGVFLGLGCVMVGLIISIISMVLKVRKGASTMTEIFWLEDGKLAGSSYPSTHVLKELYEEGLRVLIPLEERNDIPELEMMGFKVHPIYVQDFTAPTIPQLEEFNRIVEEAGGVPVLVHCLGGYGRTWTMLAAYLIKNYSASAEKAISFVREKRPGAVEVPEQVRILKEYEEHLRGERVKKHES